MKTPRKMNDLTRRGAAPLLVQRPQRFHSNLLVLDQAAPTRRRDFELKATPSTTESLFLPAHRFSQRLFSKIQFGAGALILVLLLNFFGVFGSGKLTVERTLDTAFTGLFDLLAAGQSFAAGDFDDAGSQFATAATAFRTAEDTLLTLGGAGAVLATKPEGVQAGSRLVTAGRLLSTAGTRFAAAADELAVTLSTWERRQQAASRGETVKSATEELSSAFAKIATGLAELESAAAVLALVEVSALPTELQDQVATARTQLDFLAATVQPYTTALPYLSELLGDRVPRRYLLLFQNPDEIRATGGFIGNIGELTINDGFITEFTIRNVYELDGQLQKKLPPPEGFGFITNTWGLRDANYHPDFPTSAAAAAYLYEQSGGGTVDGVVAITSDLLTRLTELTGGEIQLARFAEPIPAADLNTVLSLVIENKVDGADSPKQILNEVWAVLVPQLKDLTPSDWAVLVSEAVSAKEVQFWSGYAEFEQLAQATKTAGAFATTTGDYLFVVDTSISGNKSDRYTSNALIHETDIDSAGTTIDTLTLTRTHAWSAAEEARMQILASRYDLPYPEELRDILGRGRNVDLVKVFIPAGSELLTVKGIPGNRIETHVDAATGRTYFLFSLTVQPGASREVVLEYQLPQKFQTDYQLTTEYQAGTHSSALVKVVRREGVEIFTETVALTASQEFAVAW